MIPKEQGRLIKGIRQQLQRLESFGVQFVPAVRWAEGGRTAISCGSDVYDSCSEQRKEEKLEPVRQKALGCTACRLCKSRRNVVFGEGSLGAALVFVGEGPGRDEDEQGRPFVGAAGGLLTKIIQAMGMSRERVYIANTVKCRPPMNRPPQPDEIEACAPFLEAQLETIHPRVIVLLGKTAATALLKMELPMRQMRGREFLWREIPVLVTYHPAYLLRNPAAKKEVWEDMKRVLALLQKGR